MRRRTLLLAAGLLAYLFGATVRAYLRPVDADNLRGYEEVGDRVIAIGQHPREALSHPLMAIEFLATGRDSD